jgi:hypothetical protein
MYSIVLSSLGLKFKQRKIGYQLLAGIRGDKDAEVSGNRKKKGYEIKKLSMRERKLRPSLSIHTH